jgi:hypothetical protein
MEANIQIIGILEYQYQRNHEAGRALKCTKVITEKTKRIRRDLVSFIKFESEFKLRTQETSGWNRIISVRLVLEGTSEF